MVFRDYAEYYDLLYKDKSYEAESNYIASLLRECSRAKTRTVLDLGCGTGNHGFILTSKGYKVTGIDRSDRMIEIAKKKEKTCLEFIQGDVRSINLGKKYDAVISLFHVASYQTSNEDLVNYFRTIKKHVNERGVFIFDFWYGPAVLTDRPTTRVKRIDNDDMTILRIAEPEHISTSNVVNVNYEVLIEKKSTGDRFIINELHSMRYLFVPELLFFMKTAELISNDSDVIFEEWMTRDVQTERSWNVVCIGKNVCG